MRRTSSQQIAGLLDALGDNDTDLRTELRESMLYDLPFKLLARGLEECGEETDLPRLYSWLSIVADPLDSFHWEGRDIRPVQTWLEDHPDIQKAIFLAWLRHCDQTDSDSLNSIEFCDVLLGSSLPSDFGRWCLAAAVELSDTEPSVAQDLLTQSYRLLQDHGMNEGLSLDILRSRTRGHGGLEQRLEELCTPRPNPELSEAQQRRRALLEERREKERGQQLERESDLRSQVAELRENRFFPLGLHSLAQVYFGKIGGN